MAKITKRTWTTASGAEREAWVFDYVDQNGKRAKRQFPTKKEATAFRIDIEGKISRGEQSVDGEKMTVADVCASYAKALKAEVDLNIITEQYYRTTKGHLFNYVCPDSDEAKEHKAKQREGDRVTFDKGIGKLKLPKCTRPAVIQFKDDLRAAEVGVVSTRRILGSLSRAMNFARDEGWIRTANPAAGVTVKAPKGERGKNKTKVVMPTKEEFKLARDLATGSLAMRIRLAAATGLRASEMYALQWGDVSFNAGELSVTRRADAQGKVDVTKSEAGKRVVPMSASLLAELKAWKENATKSEAGDLIFPNARGNHIDHRNALEREFKPLMELAAAKAKETKVKFKPFRWHSLRHFAISTWIEAGFQPKVIQVMAGHSTLAVTMDIYGDIFPSEDRRNVMDSIAAELA
ncbi:tyrosine-type recombinase/integrase [Rhizobium rhizogenes]|uniref:Phage integrase protein n=1 Tax=Rhizobium rhizogenes (strain K84 / ATCC BAA-868) TaxID=311403 RepID=B9JBV5_RHIR8|nr:Phage integrase protein [Rhizobium rhizogenes K84]